MRGFLRAGVVRRPAVRLIPYQLALFGGAAIAILAGASFNIQGHSGEAGLYLLVAGFLAFVAGLIHLQWRRSGPMLVAAAVIGLAANHFNLKDPILRINLAGLLCLGLGGTLGSMAYGHVTAEMRRRLRDLEAANRKLEEQHRLYLAATEDPSLQAGDIPTMEANTARQTGAAVCCYYLLSPDAAYYVPQPPGVGLDGFRPHPVRRTLTPSPLLSAIESNQEFSGESVEELRELFDYVPPQFAFANSLVEPIPVGEHVGGFVLLANKDAGWSPDDRRLARTLAMRAGANLASVNAVAVSQKEADRYALLNELVKQASGLTFEEVLALVMSKAKDLIEFDSARVALFGSDGTYTMTDAKGYPQSVKGGPFEAVLLGQSVVRGAVTTKSGIFSGLEPGAEGGAVSEALIPIRGRTGVLGSICLGRKRANTFGDRDLPMLDELGTMAGVAIENAHTVQQISGQANKLDTAIDALSEMSDALTAVTQGVSFLERKTVESAARLEGCSFGLLTRAVEPGKHRISVGMGFGEELAGAEVQNGQGVIGAVILSGNALSIPDLASSWDLTDPTLAPYGVRGAICVPMREGEVIWGTLSVFDVNPRSWTSDDVRVLQTLGNEAVVAVKNAELYDQSKKMIWELTNLHDGLKAVSSTLDLGQVMELVLSGGAKAADAQIGCLAIEEGGKLQVVGAFGTDHATAERLALGLGGDLCNDVMHSGEPLMEAMGRTEGKAAGPLDPRSVLCVPVNLHGRPIGVIFLANYVANKPFTEDHKRLVTALAAQAAVAIDNARLFKDREEVTLASLQALAAAVDARDKYTAGHSKRVTEYALIIARQMGYAPGDEPSWRRLRQGGLLHDIGKIGVPDAVLQKPGRLTDAEFAAMKAHPVVGYNILRDLKMLSDELIIVRSHHERFDGRGYPDGKKNGELPIYAWMVSAADALDAMTSDRPYRKGMSLEVALAEITKGAGTHFHPDVAEAVADAAHAGALKIIPQESLYEDAPVVGVFENPTS